MAYIFFGLLAWGALVGVAVTCGLSAKRYDADIARDHDQM